MINVTNIKIFTLVNIDGVFYLKTSKVSISKKTKRRIVTDIFKACLILLAIICFYRNYCLKVCIKIYYLKQILMKFQSLNLDDSTGLNNRVWTNIKVRSTSVEWNDKSRCSIVFNSVALLIISQKKLLRWNGHVRINEFPNRLRVYSCALWPWSKRTNFLMYGPH